MTVLSRVPREWYGFELRFAANDNDARRAARDVAAGACWAFRDHRTMAEVIAAERGR